MRPVGGEDGAARLERAIEVFVRYVESGGRDARGLLTAHADLRDLLEPMLASDGGVDRGGVGGRDAEVSDSSAP